MSVSIRQCCEKGRSGSKRQFQEEWSHEVRPGKFGTVDPVLNFGQMKDTSRDHCVSTHVYCGREFIDRLITPLVWVVVNIITLYFTILHIQFTMTFCLPPY